MDDVVVEKTCRVLVNVKASTMIIPPPLVPLLFMDDSSSDKDSIWSRMMTLAPIDIVILILGIIVMICFMGELWVID